MIHETKGGARLDGMQPVEQEVDATGTYYDEYRKLSEWAMGQNGLLERLEIEGVEKGGGLNLQYAYAYSKALMEAHVVFAHNKEAPAVTGAYCSSKTWREVGTEGACLNTACLLQFLHG